MGSPIPLDQVLAAGVVDGQQLRLVPPEVVRLLPEKLIRARRVLPIALASESRRGPLLVATIDPRDLTVLDEVAFASGKAVRPVLASERDLEQAIEHHFARPGRVMSRAVAANR